MALRALFSSKFERGLLACVLAALALLVAVKVKFGVADYMHAEWPRVVLFFQSKAFEDIAGDLLTGIIAAYFFYLIVEVLPRFKREQNNRKVLNLIVASIVQSYHKADLFGHALEIEQVDLSLLDSENIDKIIEEVKSKADFIRLKCSLFTAHSRYSDFSSTLGIASSLSAEHALQWLVLTDKVRLLVDNYEQDPDGQGYEPRHVFGTGRDEINDDAIDFLEYESKLISYVESLQFGMLEYLEKVKCWVK